MKLFVFIILFSALTSCEKVIDVNLKDTSPALVAEGILKEGINDVNVVLTKTTDFYNLNVPPPVTGAMVTLSDSIVTRQFSEVSPGRYILAGYNAVPGKSYKLSVNTGGNVHEATSYLPFPVVLDSISYKYEPSSAFTDEGYLIYAEFNDPPATENYYRIKLTVNDTLKNNPDDLFVFDDQLTNGRHIKIPIFIKRFKRGDHIKMELISMDKNVYKYFLTLTTIISNNGQPSAAPANPTSNYSGGILGYFGAFSSTFTSVTLP